LNLSKERDQVLQRAPKTIHRPSCHHIDFAAHDGLTEPIEGRCGDLLLLETCVSFGAHEAINAEPESQSLASQSFQGMGCRPTRPWIFNHLKRLFAHVYATKTQPAHEEFPLDWTTAPPGGGFHRAVFVASRRPLSKPLLLDHLPDRQTAA
jgi:hypothetical protein